MRVHRFYTGQAVQLKKDFWVHDEALLWQWSKVLRFREGQEVILFDGEQTDRLYRILELKKTEAHLTMVTELERRLPVRHVYLFWSLLKKDNNDFILQKCTELGVSNFVPLLTERSIRDNFNIDRARKIVQEASEQCGRSNIPAVREPMHVQTALREYKDKVKFFICEQGSEAPTKLQKHERYGIFIGPEGGWSDAEKQLFQSEKLAHLHINDFTLRAETAAIVASAKLL
ncbi:MAG: RsmE family RNA methyltransferase [Candidatus Saccharimonadales bacterium]